VNELVNRKINRAIPGEW